MESIKYNLAFKQRPDKNWGGMLNFACLRATHRQTAARAVIKILLSRA